MWNVRRGYLKVTDDNHVHMIMCAVTAFSHRGVLTSHLMWFTVQSDSEQGIIHLSVCSSSPASLPAPHFRVWKQLINVLCVTIFTAAQCRLEELSPSSQRQNLYRDFCWTSSWTFQTQKFKIRLKPTKLQNSFCQTASNFIDTGCHDMTWDRQVSVSRHTGIIDHQLLRGKQCFSVFSE